MLPLAPPPRLARCTLCGDRATCRHRAADPRVHPQRVQGASLISPSLPSRAPFCPTPLAPSPTSALPCFSHNPRSKALNNSAPTFCVAADICVVIAIHMQVPNWSSDGGSAEEAEAAEGGGEAEDEEAASARSPAENDPMEGFRVPLNARTMHEKVCVVRAARIACVRGGYVFIVPRVPTFPSSVYAGCASNRSTWWYDDTHTGTPIKAMHAQASAYDERENSPGVGGRGGSKPTSPGAKTSVGAD